jgi:hypothetical protein
VYVEAWYFWNILVTTDVWWAYDITNNEKHWCVFQQKNYIKAIDYISQHISNNDVHIYWNKSTNFIQDQFNYVSYLKNIINTF